MGVRTLSNYSFGGETGKIWADTIYDSASSLTPRLLLH